MNQAELNKKAMADIFAIEDSKDLFESIGALNDDKAFGDPAVDQGGEYGPDDMLTVIPGSTDPFAGQSITAQAQQEPSDDDKRFVVDRFAELMANDHKNVVTPAEIDGYSPIIQKEVGSRMNVNQFLTDVHNDATQRLAAQNVSEAQPEGASTDEIAPQGAEPAAPVDPAAADPLAMGTPEMTPAEGGIAPEPTLDANVGEDPLAGGEDLGLGAIDDGAGFDGFGAEPAPEGDLGLDGITDDAAGDLGAEEPAAEPAAEGEGLGLDGIPAEGDEGAEPAAEPAAEDDALAGDTNLDNLSDDELGGDEDEKGSDEETASEDEDKVPASDDDDADFEAEMAENRAILESIYKKYSEDVARKNVRTIVESHLRKRQEEKQAMLESQTAEMKKEQEIDAKGAEMREALGKKVEGLVEAADEKKAEAILESAAKAYAKAVENKKAASEGLKAKLESISANYHKVVEKDAARKAEEEAAEGLKAKLESIVDGAKPLTESAAEPAKEPTLEERLDAIVKSAD